LCFGFGFGFWEGRARGAWSRVGAHWRHKLAAQTAKERSLLCLLRARECVCVCVCVCVQARSASASAARRGAQRWRAGPTSCAMVDPPSQSAAPGAVGSSPSASTLRKSTAGGDAAWAPPSLPALGRGVLSASSSAAPVAAGLSWNVAPSVLIRPTTCATPRSAQAPAAAAAASLEAGKYRPTHHPCRHLRSSRALGLS
jgi:hypothetical protein